MEIIIFPVIFDVRPLQTADASGRRTYKIAGIFKEDDLQGIRRYWLLMSMAHFMCVTGTGEFCSFEKGYHRIGSIIQTEKYQYLFRCAKESNDFDAFMKLAG